MLRLDKKTSVTALALVAGSGALLLGAATGKPTGEPDAMTLTFQYHVDNNMPEQDVFIERQSGSGKVWRVTGAQTDMSKRLYATANPVEHNPFNADALGPYDKGKPLGLTLGEWYASKGAGEYTCDHGQGKLETEFTNLVPEATYTMWYFFMPMPPSEPFTGTLDLPLGARDGSQNTFTTDAQGNARYTVSFKPCLQLTGRQLASGLAIAWHSDGKTYGGDPGEFGEVSHVQTFAMLPTKSDASN